MNNKAVIIIYKKLSPGDIYLKNDEISAILNAESESYRWVEIDRRKKNTNSQRFQNDINSATKAWTREDGAIAYVSGNSSIMIVSAEAMNFDIQAQNQKEKAKKKTLSSF